MNLTRGIVSVKDYGAKGDGVSDDTVAIQRAMNAASDLDLIFPANSTYVVSAPLTRTSGKLRIHGNGATIKVAATYPTQEVETGIIDARGLDEVNVIGLTIDGNSAAMNDGQGWPDWQNFIHMVLARGARVFRVRDCYVKNFPSQGIQARDCESVYIEGNRVEDGMQHPIFAKDCANVWITKNVVSGRGNVGEDPLIGGIGIHLDLCDYVDVSGNHVKDAGDTGIKGQGCDYVNCERNTVEDSGKDGIKWMGVDGNSTPRFARIAHNMVNRINAWRPDGSALIMVNDYRDAYVGGNQVYNGGGTRVADGIRCTPYVGTTISRHTIEGNRGESIDGRGILVENITGLIVRGNHFDAHIQVVQTDGDVLIDGNTLNNGGSGTIDSSNVGLQVSDISSGSVAIQNNIISEYLTGISAYAKPGVTIDSVVIAGNTVKTCHQFGIRVDNFGGSSTTIRVLDVRDSVCRDTCSGVSASAAIRIGVSQLSIGVARVTRNTVQNLTSNTITAWLELNGSGDNKIGVLDVSGVFVAGVTGGYAVSGAARATIVRGYANELVPTQISTSQNNYAPPGMSEVLLLSSSSDVDITGFANGAALKSMYVHNTGSFSITLKHQNASSTGSNRIIGRGGVDTVLYPNTGAYLYYPSTILGRWLVVALAEAPEEP